jgi:hypothetical protein
MSGNIIPILHVFKHTTEPEFFLAGGEKPGVSTALMFCHLVLNIQVRSLIILLTSANLGIAALFINM